MMRTWLLLAALLGCVPAWAQTTVTTRHATARLIADVGSLRPGQTASVGLQLTVAPGWHTYWKDPGDAGAPPVLSWTLPPGVTVGEPAFPPPTVLDENGLKTNTLSGIVLLSAPLQVATPPASLRLHAGWLVCRDICVPEEADLSLDLPAGNGGPGSDAALFMPHAAPPVAAPAIWATLGAALLGGLLLNLMPCVFPVLALKAAGLAALGGRARRGAVGYAAGAIGTFVALGAALILARAEGAALGWGFQLQSTPFVLGMALALFAIGLNLSGVFAVGAGRLTGLGQGVASRGGVLGDVATGALTVLVAAQCTAPFMATALARALTAPPAEALAVFAGLGIGLAAPYVLVAFVPAFRRALPRPGAWMEVLRQALAFPLYAAAGWLAWVAIVQAGSDAALAAIAGAVAVGLAAWLLGRAQAARRPATRGIASALAALAGTAAAATLLLPLNPAPMSGAERFSAGRLVALRGEGHPVFVDMSAAWCIPCLINERVALAAPSVQAAFSAGGVRLLRGDWTRRDGDISAYLAAQGRDGVPLYQLYPAGTAPPRTLPQLLTPGIVLAALRDQATGTQAGP